ncbi:MAG: 2-dehydropantoate 2-reductase [Proteobacteria bacterium]|nr:2-dehydropantoate 2-reductase [Pseudomonadota bacterium]
MKVCIYGAGAIGGFIGARLAAAGQAEVSAVARGATLAALREHGWRLREGGSLRQAKLARAGAPAEVGPQDVVVVAVKGTALADVATSMAPLLAPHTIVLPAMNGVPWWFLQSMPQIGDAPLESVDPGGRIAAGLPLSHVVGCVVHASTWTSEPGLVEHRNGNGLIVGEPRGGASARVDELAALLRAAGFEARASDRIRHDIWYKLWGNMTVNPVSALTGATVDRIMADPLVVAFCTRAMLEAGEVGARIGCAIDQRPDDRHAITRSLGRFRTSMQQDVEAERPIELDALVTVVREIGQRVGVATPNIDTLLGLTRLFGRVRGLYPEA